MTSAPHVNLTLLRVTEPTKGFLGLDEPGQTKRIEIVLTNRSTKSQIHFNIDLSAASVEGFTSGCVSRITPPANCHDFFILFANLHPFASFINAQDATFVG